MRRFVNFSYVYDCNNSFKAKSVVLKLTSSQKLIKTKYYEQVYRRFMSYASRMENIRRKHI